MKAVGRLQVLNEESTNLSIDPEIASAAKLQAQSLLEAVVLLPAEANTKDDTKDLISRMTLIATSLPESSWGNLVRLSTTLDPKPGSLRKMIEVFNELHLHCRYVETINDIDLRGRRLLDLDLEEYPLDGSSSDESSVDDGSAEERRERISSLIIPSTMVVIELPQDYTNLKLEKNAKSLHKHLRNLADDNVEQDETKDTARSLLQGLLAAKVGNVEVDWISPLSTLNRLHRQLNHDSNIKARRWFTRRLLVKGNEMDGLPYIDLLPLQHILWDAGILPARPSLRPRVSAFVKAFVDTDEKVICWDFYQLSNDLVVQFDLKTSSHGGEHHWWKWIYQCVEDAGGNLLASESLTRVYGGWASLRTTAVFPLREDAKAGEFGDIGKIVNCFRELQGNRGFADRYDVLIDIINRQTKDSPYLFAKRGRRQLSKTEALTLLENVHVWDPSDGSTSRDRSYQARFVPNPFNFTMPLDLESYDLLYGDHPDSHQEGGLTDNNDTSRSRRALAISIVERVAIDTSENLGENIAIVGAHRSGKTTVLNLVYDLLKNPDLDFQGTKTLIPIKIDAAMDPPHMFLPAVIRNLKAIAGEQETEGKTATAGSVEIVRGAKQLLDRIFDVAKDIEIPLDLLVGPLLGLVAGVPVGTEGTPPTGVAIGFRGLLEMVNPSDKKKKGKKNKNVAIDWPESAESTYKYMRVCMNLLREALAEDVTTRLIIIVDEFSQSSRWGNDQALPLWRYVIESREFARIKWVISTSRRIQDSIGYSPITNVLIEFNVGSLSRRESERLLDAFSIRSWRKNRLKEDRAGVADKDLQPLLLEQTRILLIKITSRLPYLLQVVCYHLYDRARRTHIPLINRRLCVDIICDYVLPELSDYLERQWSQLEEEDRLRIRGYLPKKVSQKDFLLSVGEWGENIQELPQGLRKSLERLGLRGNDSYCVAPLVACWLMPVNTPAA